MINTWTYYITGLLGTGSMVMKVCERAEESRRAILGLLEIFKAKTNQHKKITNVLVTYSSSTTINPSKICKTRTDWCDSKLSLMYKWGKSYISNWTNLKKRFDEKKKKKKIRKSFFLIVQIVSSQFHTFKFKSGRSWSKVQSVIHNRLCSHWATKIIVAVMF